MAPKSGDEFDDDFSVPSETRLLRRIPPRRISPKGDGSFRPNSDCFANDPNDGTGMSVDIWVEGLDPLLCIQGHEGFGLVWFSVADIRRLGMGVCQEPLEENERHALIQGKKTHGRKRAIAHASSWVAIPAAE